MAIDKTNEERLLKAAEIEFLTKGYSGAKTTEIAANAGMTHSMLHYYFRSKEQLFNQVVAGKIEILSRTMNVLLQNQQMPLKQRIRAMVEQHFDMLAQNPLLPRFAINLANEHPELLQQSFTFLRHLTQMVGTSLQQDINDAADRGEICHVNAINLVFDIVSVNFFTFMAMPAAKILKDNINIDESEYLSSRREENIQLILKRLEK